MPADEFRGDSELSLNPRRQTGGLREVVSFDAVLDPDLHTFGHGLPILSWSGCNRKGLEGGISLRLPAQPATGEVPGLPTVFLYPHDPSRMRSAVSRSR
jgi:hypothetical protein